MEREREREYSVRRDDGSNAQNKYMRARGMGLKYSDRIHACQVMNVKRREGKYS